MLMVQGQVLLAKQLHEDDVLTEGQVRTCVCLCVCVCVCVSAYVCACAWQVRVLA
jgi:hypothetical protein